MLRLYVVGFGLMAVIMIVVGVALFAVTLENPPTSGSTPEWVWLLRAAVAVVMGVVAGILSTLAWRQSRRPSA